MKEGTQRLLVKASRAISRPPNTAKKQPWRVFHRASRSATFYTAEALLNEKDLRYNKHGGVHGAFGEYFVKTGLFDVKFHRWLLDAFDQRIEGDYGVEVLTTDQDARELIDQAKHFLQAASIYLNA